MVKKIRGMKIGALNTDLPLQVEYGQSIAINQVQFEYQGPTALLFVCWAPKPKASTDFNNGENIPGDIYGYAQLDVSDSPDWTSYTIDLTGAPNVAIQMQPDIHVDNMYDTWVWMTEEQATPDESYFIASDSDADVIEILQIPEISNLQVKYAIYTP